MTGIVTMLYISLVSGCFVNNYKSEIGYTYYDYYYYQALFLAIISFLNLNGLDIEFLIF